MIVWSLLLVTVVLGLLSLRLLRNSGRGGWLQPVLALFMALFIYLYGAWIYLSFYVKYAFGISFLLVLITVFLRRQRPPARPAGRMAGNVLCGAGIVVFAALSVLYFTGTTGRAPAISLQFPLKHGSYFVFQGGKGLPANLFHATGRHAIYAMDIVRLNHYGQRCRRIFSARLDDYFIYGDTVFAPCDGRVGRAVSDNPDNIPPNHERGPHNLNGVLLENERCYVFLGHLKQNAVFVQEGDWVKAGAPLGLAGNSGFSIEPHLHIQAHRKTDTGLPWYREPPLFILFSGKAYLLFERIKTASLSPDAVPR